MQKIYYMLTKNKKELLALFFANPDKAFYLREIGRIIGKQPGVFQRAVNSMVKEGLLQSEYRANTRCLKINRDYPLYKELKSIIGKTAGLVAGIKDGLDKIKNIRLAFIYGSYAKGAEQEFSDIDLMIVGNPDEGKLIDLFDSLEKKFQREINYTLYSPGVFKKALKDQDPFLLNVINGKKDIIIGGENGFR